MQSKSPITNASAGSQAHGAGPEGRVGVKIGSENTTSALSGERGPAPAVIATEAGWHYMALSDCIATLPIASLSIASPLMASPSLAMLSEDMLSVAI